MTDQEMNSIRYNEVLEGVNEELYQQLISMRQDVHDAAIELNALQETCHTDTKAYDGLKDSFHELLFNGALERCKIFPQILQNREERSSSDYVFGKVIESRVRQSVVEAVRHWDGKQAMVKIWTKSSFRTFRQMSRIHNELITLKKLQHRNTIHLMDVWETQEDLYVAYECFGKDLYYTLEHYNKTPDSLIRQVTTPLIDALSYIHSHNIAHCDLKPENIMVRTNDDESISSVKLVDFELAVEVGDDHTLPKEPRGSKGFMAPEMFHGIAYNPLKCDIWSLGCVLLELHLRGEFEDRWLTHYPRVIDGNFHLDEFIEDLKLELEIISSEIKDSSFHSLLMSTLQISPRQRSSAFELIPHDQNVRKVIHDTKLPPIQVKRHRLRIRIDDSMPEYESGPDDYVLAQFDIKKSASPGCISRIRLDFD